MRQRPTVVLTMRCAIAVVVRCRSTRTRMPAWMVTSPLS